MLACTSTANNRRSKPNEELNSAKAGSVSPVNRPPQRFVFVLSLMGNDDFVMALLGLTWLHDSGYFMHLCGNNATIMHHAASECPTNFSLSRGWLHRGGLISKGSRQTEVCRTH